MRAKANRQQTGTLTAAVKRAARTVDDAALRRWLLKLVIGDALPARRRKAKAASEGGDR
jgi:hypothetical protein